MRDLLIGDISDKLSFSSELILNNYCKELSESTHTLDSESTKRTAQKNQKLSILDIGTGSGCIAISLAKKLNNAVVSAIDISTRAIEVAKKNTLINNVNIEFSRVDVLNFEADLDLHHKWESKFDIIVSNPPYVRMQEKKLMKLNVVDHEPDIALFVKDDDPLLFYRKISQLSKQYLRHHGTLYLEINEYLGVEMEKMLNEAGFKHVELKKDMFGKNRMIKCW